MNAIENLRRRNKLSIALLGFVIVCAIGIVDFFTGYEFSFSLFYVIPIALVTWFGGRRIGIMMSLLSAAVWLGADAASGHIYAHPLIPFWNTLIRLSFFIIITMLLSALKGAMEREKEYGRTDSLTGAVNSRVFLEMV